MLVIFVNKVVGLDSISYKMFKFCKEIILKFLCFLFNKLLIFKIFFDCWKLVYVIFLFKKDDLFIILNYRFVLLLSCISKIFERILFKYLYNFLYVNNLFYKY